MAHAAAGELMPVASVNGVQVSTEPLLNGWGRLGENLSWTGKAGCFVYHGWTLWIAKANMMIWDGAYYAKTFALTSAKQSNFDRRNAGLTSP